MSSLYERASNRYSNPFRYIKGILDYAPDQYLSHKDMRLLPRAALSKIGNQTIDVFPWDVNYLLQNRLNYHPRPCFQTFQANSEYLQDINYQFYEKEGPAFVLYDYDAIDDAYPFNDAAKLNLFLARNYEVVDSFMANERWRILLSRKPQTNRIRLTRKITEETINKPFSAEPADFVKLQVTYTAFGKFHAFWDKPSPLLISYQRENGEWLTYKTSTELLKSGLYVGYLIRTTQEFAKLVCNDTASLEKVKRVRIIGDERHYQKEINVKYSE